MGADGGNYNDDRKVIVTLKKEKEKPSKELLNNIGWSFCQFSNQPLKPPIVCDQFGQMYNKEALLKAMVNKTLDKKKFGHIKSLKDLNNANLTLNPNQEDGKPLFICPVSKKELTGSFKFYLLKGCGHVVYEDVLKELGEKECPVCNKELKFGKILLNQSREQIEEMKKKVLEKRKIEKEDEKELKKQKIEKIDAPKNSDPEIWNSLFVDPNKKKSNKNDFLMRDGMKGPTNI